jgi:hypothetical protein
MWLTWILLQSGGLIYNTHAEWTRILFQSSLEYHITTQPSSTATQTKLQIHCIYKSMWCYYYYYASQVSGSYVHGHRWLYKSNISTCAQDDYQSRSWRGCVQKSPCKMHTPIFHINFGEKVHLVCWQIWHLGMSIIIKFHINIGSGQFDIESLSLFRKSFKCPSTELMSILRIIFFHCL